MVVASGCRVHNAGFDRNRNAENNLKKKSNNMMAKGVLICRDNSHAFQERTLNLDQAVKIGRSVARAREATNNAIFDCKVLSRNHALLWYSNGKFYLQDTKSSNGTFVNNQRLSSTGLESTPREVCSGDIVQFGVDVMESAKKVTHGCIVATLKLYLPDGKEAKASCTMSAANPAGDVSMEDLYKLYHYIQEASRREKVLQGKLSHLQTLVKNTKLATDQSWKALIDEDHLLARIKAVESQLLACSKNLTEDKIRSELVRLEEEKAQYQTAAKEALYKAHQEKLEVTRKLAQLESRLNETEEECQSLHDVSKHARLELQELAAKYTEAQRNLQFMENKLAEKEENSWEIVKWAMQEKKDLSKKADEPSRAERCLQARLRNCWVEDPFNIPKHIAAMRNYMQSLVDMCPKLVSEIDSALIKDAVNPIKAINGILNKLEGLLAEINNDNESINDTNLTSTDNERNEADSRDNESKRMIIIENSGDDRRPHDKNELDDAPNNRDNATSYIVRPAGALTAARHQRHQQMRSQKSSSSSSSSRRTLVNGGSANLDDSAESDNHSESNDDTGSVASDDTIDFNDDTEKSVIETKRVSNERDDDSTFGGDSIRETDQQQQQKLEVRFASGANGKDLEEVHYDHAYRPEEEFADVATAINDDDSSDSIEESPNESFDRRYNNDNNDKDIDKPESLELDEAAADVDEEGEHLDGEYVKTLKPIGNSVTQNCSETRVYVLRTLISSLESLRGEDDDREARQAVKRELDELRDWLVRETTESVLDRLKELYYRAKNENQRIQEVNEELVILKEKYNRASDEKAELLKSYNTLKSECGDLLNSSYSVPIQYVAPIAIVILWILFEKFF